MNIGGKYEIKADNGTHVCEFLGLSETGAMIRWVDTGHETEIAFEGIVYLAQTDAIKEYEPY